MSRLRTEKQTRAGQAMVARQRVIQNAVGGNADCALSIDREEDGSRESLTTLRRCEREKRVE